MSRCDHGYRDASGCPTCNPPTPWSLDFARARELAEEMRALAAARPDLAPLAMLCAGLADVVADRQED